MTGVPDIVGPNLRILFCGINPGMLSGRLGQHFARPGNRFWKLLAASGLTDRVLAPIEQDRLLGYGLGITNLVEATTASAAELSAADLRAGAPRLEAKAAALTPVCVAVLGMQAYRVAFGRPARHPRPPARARSGSRCCGCCPTRAASRPATSCRR